MQIGGEQQATKSSKWSKHHPYGGGIAPKKHVSASFVFIDEFQKELKEMHPKVIFVVAIDMARGDKWKSMSEDAKAPFVKMAKF